MQTSDKVAYIVFWVIVLYLPVLVELIGKVKETALLTMAVERISSIVDLCRIHVPSHHKDNVWFELLDSVEEKVITVTICSSDKPAAGVRK